MSNGDNVDALPFQQKIVMLTDIIENDESKCAIYFPQNVTQFLCFLSNEERRQPNCQQSQAQLDAFFAEHGTEWFDLVQPNEIHTEVIGENWESFPKMCFNFFSIKTVKCLNKSGYAIRKFHCMYHTFERLNSCDTVDNDADNSARTEEVIERKAHLFTVYHYWFPHWPDHRSPENIDVVLDMCINLIDSDSEQELSTVQNDLSGNIEITIEDMDDETAASTSHNLQMIQSMPITLNQIPFNGAMPIIHWLVCNSPIPAISLYLINHLFDLSLQLCWYRSHGLRRRHTKWASPTETQLFIIVNIFLFKCRNNEACVSRCARYCKQFEATARWNGSEQ